MNVNVETASGTGVADSDSILAVRNDAVEFRRRLRSWLASAIPAGWREKMAGASDADYAVFQRTWFTALQQQGLATAHWPAEWGGVDLSVALQRIVYEELSRARSPMAQMYLISLVHLPATLLHWGNAAQKERYINGVLRGDVWCQGFSEPNAGSDLASLRTRAVRSGDMYVVNGQKIWTSMGMLADYCLLLARTDPDAPKHKGISYFILDMKSPGLTVRPIVQANGQAEFVEVFLDNVEIPLENLIGPENHGWTIAQSTLSAERGLIIFERSERMRQVFGDILASVRATQPAWYDDDSLRREFTRAYVDSEALSALIRRMLDARDGDIAVAAEPMYIKLFYTELLQRFTELMTRIEGLSSQLYAPGVLGVVDLTFNWTYDHISSWGWTISGGTNEVMRNIIAERILGLPR